MLTYEDGTPMYDEGDFAPPDIIWAECPLCEGTGEGSYDMSACRQCGGRGEIEIQLKGEDEFVVVDITASKDGLGILQCITDDGVTFSVSAPGTMENKRKVLEDKEIYIGALVNVSYINMTANKVPFHPVCNYWV